MQSGPTNESTVFGFTWKQLGAFLLYPAGKSLGVIPTQPIFKIATQQQAEALYGKPENLWKTAQSITTKEGVAGLWDGTAPGMGREALKASYKGPLQVSGVELAEKYISPEYSFFRGALAGMYVGGGDAAIASIIEPYKVFKTKEGSKTNIFKYLNQIKEKQQHQPTIGKKIAGGMQELSRGFGVTAVKQSWMNTVFFSAREWIKKTLKPYQAEHPKAVEIITVLFPAFSAGLAGGPLDLGKSLKQIHVGDKQAVLALLKKVREKNGNKALFAGAPGKIGLVGFGYSLNGLFLSFYSWFGKNAAHVQKSDKAVEKLTDDFKKLSLSEPKPLLFRNPFAGEDPFSGDVCDIEAEKPRRKRVEL